MSGPQLSSEATYKGVLYITLNIKLGTMGTWSKFLGSDTRFSILTSDFLSSPDRHPRHV